MVEESDCYFPLLATRIFMNKYYWFVFKKKLLCEFYIITNERLFNGIEFLMENVFYVNIGKA